MYTISVADASTTGGKRRAAASGNSSETHAAVPPKQRRIVRTEGEVRLETCVLLKTWWGSHMHAHACMHACTQMYKHTCIQMHMHACTHTHTCLSIHLIETAMAIKRLATALYLCVRNVPIVFVCKKHTITTITVYFIHPSGKRKQSFDRTMKTISQ